MGGTDDGVLGAPLSFDALVEPLHWGRSRYTIVRVPDALVRAARDAGTRRVAGEIEGEPVNLALTTAPLVDGAFVYAGASLLRRLRAAAGRPVTCRLAPVDPDLVPLPEDVEEALDRADLLDAWESLAPATRRRRLYAVDSVASTAGRARRIGELLRDL